MLPLWDTKLISPLRGSIMDMMQTSDDGPL
jgi:hypothetical protein